MNTDNLFSYNSYKKIIQKYKSFNRDYSDCIDESEFFLLRHDVEFSMSRALEMAKIDHSLDITSTFLFQVKSNAYNDSELDLGETDELVEDQGIMNNQIEKTISTKEQFSPMIDNVEKKVIPEKKENSKDI